MKISTKTIVTVGMFTAVLSVLSVLSIPMPSGVPLTLQTFAVALCGCVLGWKRGTLAILLYIAIGTIGVPVFAGMRGGAQCLVGYTGGFLWGFIFLTLLCGAGARQRKMLVKLAFGFAGIAVCHILGVVQFSVVASVSLDAAFLTVSVPYIIKDVISVIGAYLVAVPIRKALQTGNILNEEVRTAV